MRVLQLLSAFIPAKPPSSQSMCKRMLQMGVPPATSVAGFMAGHSSASQPANTCTAMDTMLKHHGHVLPRRPTTSPLRVKIQDAP